MPRIGATPTPTPTWGGVERLGPPSRLKGPDAASFDSTVPAGDRPFPSCDSIDTLGSCDDSWISDSISTLVLSDVEDVGMDVGYPVREGAEGKVEVDKEDEEEEDKEELAAMELGCCCCCCEEST